VVDALEADLKVGGDWLGALSAEGVRIFGRKGRYNTIRLARMGGALVIGDVFDRSGRAAAHELDLPLDQTPDKIAKAMLERYWGRYLLVLRNQAGLVVGALRDPSGALDGVTWRHAGVVVIASETPELLLQHLGPRQGLNWTSIQELLADPIFGGASAPIAGMTTMAPGALVSPTQMGFQTRQLWRPAAFASTPPSRSVEIEAELRSQIDLCVAAHAALPGNILGEISGGFDSAVVASGLIRANAPVAVWCNHWTLDPGGDERIYARAMADHFGLEILERLRPPFILSPERIAESQFGPRPSAFALDLAYEQETLDLARRFGATRLFTGIGGDGLFFVSPYPPIARDLYLNQGLRGLLSPAFGDLARWCRKSVWALARLALQAEHASPKSPSATWVTSMGVSQVPRPHPWREGSDALPPAKRRHIDEQILVQLTAATSLRGRELDIVHPLLSQPLVEYCLGVPVDKLVEGGRDRAMARRAYRGRLPDAVLDRKSKGELGAYYSRAVASAIPALKTFLLEGRLAEQGLLVRPVLEQVLDVSYFAQAGGFTALLFTVAIEAWVRRWEPATL